MCCSLPACPIANESKKFDDDAKAADETPKRRPGRPPASSKSTPMTPLSPISPRKQQQLPPGQSIQKFWVMVLWTLIDNLTGDENEKK